MSNDTCKVAECDRPRKTRGWCKSHYMFWYQNRVEPTGPVRSWGSCRTRECLVDGCDRKYDSLGYCAPHYKRVVKYGEPGPTDIKPRSVGDDADYGLAHYRVQKTLGKAAEHTCVGCNRPAKQWAYDHRDPDEKYSERGYAFSLNPGHYRPMCVRCHKRFDMNRLSAAPLQELGAE